jgi:hypothetical protein
MAEEEQDDWTRTRREDMNSMRRALLTLIHR